MDNDWELTPLLEAFGNDLFKILEINSLAPSEKSYNDQNYENVTDEIISILHSENIFTLSPLKVTPSILEYFSFLTNISSDELLDELERLETEHHTIEDKTNNILSKHQKEFLDNISLFKPILSDIELFQHSIQLTHDNISKTVPTIKNFLNKVYHELNFPSSVVCTENDKFLLYHIMSFGVLLQETINQAYYEEAFQLIKILIKSYTMMNDPHMLDKIDYPLLVIQSSSIIVKECIQYHINNFISQLNSYNLFNTSQDNSSIIKYIYKLKDILPWKMSSNAFIEEDILNAIQLDLIPQKIRIQSFFIKSPIDRVIQAASLVKHYVVKLITSYQKSSTVQWDVIINWCLAELKWLLFIMKTSLAPDHCIPNIHFDRQVPCNTHFNAIDTDMTNEINFASNIQSYLKTLITDIQENQNQCLNIWDSIEEIAEHNKSNTHYLPSLDKPFKDIDNLSQIRYLYIELNDVSKVFLIFGFNCYHLINDIIEKYCIHFFQHKCSEIYEDFLKSTHDYDWSSCSLPLKIEERSIASNSLEQKMKNIKSFHLLLILTNNTINLLNEIRYFSSSSLLTVYSKLLLQFLEQCSLLLIDIGKNNNYLSYHNVSQFIHQLSTPCSDSSNLPLDHTYSVNSKSMTDTSVEYYFQLCKLLIDDVYPFLSLQLGLCFNEKHEAHNTNQNLLSKIMINHLLKLETMSL